MAIDTLLDEVWTPRARDPQNRESGQTWLRKSLKRLQEELATAAGGLPDEIVAGGQLLRLNPTTIASQSTTSTSPDTSVPLSCKLFTFAPPYE